jgi:1-acyl-sn-glycerol-3-phosphate acyltransferase
MVHLFHFILTLLVRLEISGAERIPRTGPVVLIGNHVNVIDPVLGYIIPRRYVKGMTAVETFSRFFYSFLAWSVDAIYVERGTPDRAAIRAAVQALREGHAFYISPEGTRSHHGRLQRGYGGVAVILLRAGAHIPIYPIVYTGLEHVWTSVKRLHRTRVRAVVGEPFYVSVPEGRVGHQAREQITAEIMGQLASMLPPENRGVYADQVGKAPRYLRLAPAGQVQG